MGNTLFLEFISSRGCAFYGPEVGSGLRTLAPRGEDCMDSSMCLVRRWVHSLKAMLLKAMLLEAVALRTDWEFCCFPACYASGDFADLSESAALQQACGD
jgi:hypothetical protein